mgnify:CR=1 FL=1
MDFKLVCKRACKYILEGLIVAVAALVLPQKSLKTNEVVGLAVVAAATFALLDMFTDGVGDKARLGAGFGIGAGLVGFP